MYRKTITSTVLSFVIAFLINNYSFGQQLIYLNPKMSIDKRVEDLLGRMTLEEKIGQMNIPCVYKNELRDSLMRSVDDFVEGTEFEKDYDFIAIMNACEEMVKGTLTSIGPVGGFFTMANTIFHFETRRQAELFNKFQKIAIEETRLGIPILQVEEGTHGLMCSDGTIFPEGIALGSSWNMNLIENVYAAAAREARTRGIHTLYTLVIEPIRDPRMGRNCEAYSEDTYLTSRVSEAIVIGCQGDDITRPDKVVAGLAHYPGQSQAVSGLEFGPMEMTERIFRTVFLPPWEAGINAGALGVMATHPTIDAFEGLPAHGSKRLLTDVLRKELGFEGIVLGEGNSIRTILWKNVASTQKEAGIMALNAGLDVSISVEPGYMSDMFDNVKEGVVRLDDIDNAVRRILRQKFQLGLFENPYVDPAEAVKNSLTAENQNLALQAAREGIVLLKNENNLLPLKKNIKSIAVIGPNADNELNQLGDYTPKKILHEIVTMLDGIRGKVSPGTKVEYLLGCEVMGDNVNEISKARKLAKKSDVAIVVVGESIHTNGEKRDIANLDLTGLQEDLIKAVYETGTPTIVVLINGRPLSIRWTSENIPAIVEAWFCGEKGGDAIADVIFGDYNPSGRLPVSIPRHSGQLPVYYNHTPSKEMRMERGYVDMSARPLFEFGFGLSYTDFEYKNLEISPIQTGPAGNIEVQADITNTGKIPGSEVVQLYINDIISSVETPIIELKGFEKVFLNPGETKTVKLVLTPDHLSLINAYMQRVVEPGEFEIMVGSSSRDIRLKGNINIL